MMKRFYLEDSLMQKDTVPAPKKQYNEPTLRVYGSVEELTQASTLHAGVRFDGTVHAVRSH